MDRSLGDVMVNKLKKAYSIFKEKGLKSLFLKIYTKIFYKNDRLSKALNQQYQIWINQHHLTQEKLSSQHHKNFQLNPKISILVPVYNTPINFLNDMILSVVNQTYSNWELCIADGNSTDTELKKLLKRYMQQDARIKVAFLNDNGGIVKNTRAAAEIASGEFVAFLDHDDILDRSALFYIIEEYNKCPETELFYTDEDILSSDGVLRQNPHFKPSWSLDSLRSINYICHFCVIRKNIYENLGGLRDGFDGSQDYDLILRATEISKNIVHIPQILYHWRAHSNSTAFDLTTKMYAFDAAKRALEEHLFRCNEKGEVLDGMFLSSYQIKYPINKYWKISFIIAKWSKKENLFRCIQSIIEKTKEWTYEILIAQSNKRQNLSGSDEFNKFNTQIRIVTFDDNENYVMQCSIMAERAIGETYIFLNGDIELINADWANRVIEHVQRDDIGAVGIKILYSDESIRHAGVALCKKQLIVYPFEGYPNSFTGHYELLRRIRNVTAVTDEFFAISAIMYKKFNGFRCDYIDKFHNIDFCLRVLETEKRVLWTPFAVAQYNGKKENKSEYNTSDASLFLSRWKKQINQPDKYFGSIIEFDSQI